MNVLIVEDEPLAVERLEKLISSYDSSIQVMERIDTVEEAANFMKSSAGKLDLVFLDIQLADGKSFEIFNKISYPHPVLFTTAYDEYALRAFKLNSVDYLLKPIRQEELNAAMDKFKMVRKKHLETPTLDHAFFEQLIARQTTPFKQRFLVKLGSRIQFKTTEEIAFFSAEDKICHLVHAPSGKRYIVDHTLEELEKELLDPKKFFRINRQHIIQMNAIQELRTHSGGRMEIMLSVPAGEKLFVSRNRSADFKQWLND